jgi:type II secretory pathway pseudopilin PulG
MARTIHHQSHRDSAQAGFSLVELSIGMVITLGIVAIAGALLAGSFNIRRRENKRMEAITAAQHALNYMSRDIANAGFALRRNGIVNADSDASSIRIRSNLDAFSGTESAASLAQPDEDVEYFLHKTDTDENSTRGELMRYDVNLQQSRLLVANVDDFEIYYFNQKVDYTLDPTGGIIVTTPGVTEVNDQTSVTYIVITLMFTLDAVGQPGSPGYQPASQIQLATDIALRNRNLAIY